MRCSFENRSEGWSILSDEGGRLDLTERDEIAIECGETHTND